jgi:hypothetical protein
MDLRMLGALALGLFYLVLAFGLLNILYFCIIDGDD